MKTEKNVSNIIFLNEVSENTMCRYESDECCDGWCDCIRDGGPD